MDRYPDDLFEQIRQLAARVETLEAKLQQRPALTSASSGWQMANMSIPAVSTGIHVGSNADEFFVSTPSGTVRIPDMVMGPAPQYPSSFTSPASIGSAPNATQYNQLRDDAAMLQVCLRSAIESGRDARVWATS